MAGYIKKQKKIWTTLLILLMGFGLLQFTTSQITHPPSDEPLQAPTEVMNILRRSCYDCHSNQTKLVWYDRLAPASWLVSKDVEKGRKVLNFSEWGKLSDKQKSGALFNIVNFIMLGSMPLPNYLRLHPKAKVSMAELNILKQYAVSETARIQETSGQKNLEAAGSTTINGQLNEALLQAATGGDELPKTVLPAVNGIEYPRGYGNWRLISTTDRFDNNTIRAIFGNDVAVKAIQDNNIQPWPDGAILAKVLWKRVEGQNDLIVAGDFIHAEFMIKNKVKYATTDGWGWARWVGKELKPFGKTPAFTATCTNCHSPVKAFDYVYTMPLKLKK